MSKYDTELKDFPNIFSLKGKVVVVTGGSRGLGLHAASGYVHYSFWYLMLTHHIDSSKPVHPKSTSPLAKPPLVKQLSQLSTSFLTSNRALKPFRSLPIVPNSPAYNILSVR